MSVKPIIRKIMKAGESSYIGLPKTWTEKVKLTDDDYLRMYVVDNGILVTPNNITERGLKKIVERLSEVMFVGEAETAE